MTEPLDKLGRDIEEQLRFETLLSDLSARFINLPADQVDAAIENALRRVCECLGLDLAVVWQWEYETPGIFTLTHHYRRVDGPPVSSQLQAAEAFPWALRQVRAGKSFAISSTEDVPEGAERDQESWRYLRIKSVLTFPFTTGGGAPFGAISFHAMAMPRAWSDALVKRLELVAQIFANTIARKRIEQALRESEERLRLAMDAAGAGVWSMNVRSKLVWVSDRQRELFGFAGDENVTFDSFLHVIHRDDRESVRTAVEKALQTRTQLRVEYRIGRSDGSVRWIAARGYPYGQEKSEPDRLTGIALDITERKQAETALEESRAQAATVMNSTDDLIWSVDPERFGLLTWNKTFREYFLKGRGIEIKVGMTPAELVPPDYVPFWHDIFSRAVREGSAFAEYLVVAKTRTLLLSLHNMQRDGKTFGVSVFGRDITDRKRAEKALKDNEARLASAVDIAGLGFYEVANGEAVTFLDSRAGEMVGLSGEQTLGTSALQFWLEHVDPEDLPRILDLHRRLNEGEFDQITVEFRYSHPQRGPIWLQLLSHVTERDAAGHERRTIGVFRDITTQKTAEQESRQSQNELAHAMRVSTMGELAASIAHELNQPLTAILSNAQAAQRLLTSGRPDLGEIREILADIAADDQRAGEVIRRMRSLLKKNIVDRKVIDLNAVTREVLELARTNAILKGVSLVSELPTEPLPVLGDRIQLQQVLLNLVMNSFDAMQSLSAGGRELVVRCQRADTHGVLVSVRDTGSGIPPAILPRVFEPFFTSKPDGMGMGMGLSICRSIIESHGGRIWAQNNPDRGATFQFALPIAEDEQA